MSGRRAAGRRTPLRVRLCLVTVSVLVAVLAALALFSWAMSRRFETELQTAVKQQAVSAETFNIYYFGDSTMVGEPYAPQASIPQMVEYLLDRNVSRKPVRSINLARAGSDFLYSAERLKEVIRNRNVTHPSLCVFYGGHNEFLKYQGRIPHVLFALPAIYSNLAEWANALFPHLEIDDRRFLDVGAVDLAERRTIIERYKSQMSEVLAQLRDNGVPAIVSTVAGNYADWEPNRSVFSGDGRKVEDLIQLVERGKHREADGEFQAAAEAYRAALKLCDTVAEVHYRLALCYRRLGQPAEAWDELQRAIDHDGMPIRASTAINDFIRTLDDGRAVTAVDAVRSLREHGADGLIGSDLMIDGHHPNLKGYILISRLIASAVRSRFVSVAGALQTLDESEATKIFRIDREKKFDIAVSRGRWFTKLATWRYDPRERLLRAEECFRMALDNDPARYEPHLGLGMVQFLRADAVGGESLASLARTMSPKEVDRYFRQTWVQRVRERAHRIEAMKASASLARYVNK